MRSIPPGAKVLKDYPLSKVWIFGDSIYKWQPKFLTDNEIWCLSELFYYGFVPHAQPVGMEIIRMDFIRDEAPTDAKQFLWNVDRVLECLFFSGIRHGDLTRPNVLVRDNWPILLDFSESRLVADPRPDKRPGGDRFWLKCTAQEILLETS